MFVIFSKQKGAWKFYAFFSNQAALDKELGHLRDHEVEYKIEPVDHFDIETVNRLESDLNNESK